MLDKTNNPAGPRGPKLSPREKAEQNPRNPRFAIASYCYHDCFGQEDKNSHTTKVDVKNCPNKDCSLWPFRGWQNIGGGLVGPRGKNND